MPLSAAVPPILANAAVGGLSVTRYIAPDWNARLPATVIDEPGVPLPGANVPPETVRLVTVPEPVNVPPLTLAPPLSAPLFTVVPAVLVRRPDTVAPALLLKMPALATVPAQVPELLRVPPALLAALPVQVAPLW